jgi:cytidylate kinase
VAKALLDGGHSPGNRARAVAAAEALDPTQFDEPTLKSPAVGEAASVISAVPEVRGALISFQRSFGRTPPGAVLDGRDIGTVIFPDADVKIFLTATAEMRAQRRAVELERAGNDISEAEVLADIRRRDERDTGRAAAPLKPAPEAYLLDTTHLDIDAAFRAAIDIVEAVRAGRTRG